jgi:hypothetical protein
MCLMAARLRVQKTLIKKCKLLYLPLFMMHFALKKRAPRLVARFPALSNSPSLRAWFGTDYAELETGRSASGAG